MTQVAAGGAAELVSSDEVVDAAALERHRE